MFWGQWDMKQERSGTFLSAVFVDYDNIYLSLKRKSEDAAKRFAKDAPVWLKQIETGGLITPTNGPGTEGTRRIVMNRCYGNPVPRRNTTDNSTDMNSFPFVRHHFLRSGFEIIDCPPLTAQLKNSSDIRMVMDLRDYLTHPTYFDEFIILSGDADFTPVLHRLRAHARRTVIFATDYTAAPYTAISDGEVREADLITLLVDGRIGAVASTAEFVAQAEPAQIDAARREIMADITTAVRNSPSPVPLEVLADRAVRLIGHEKTIGTSWGGAGGFRELLGQGLPDDLKLSAEPPYVVIDTRRHLIAQPVSAKAPAATAAPEAMAVPSRGERIAAQPQTQAQLSYAAPTHEAPAERGYAPAQQAYAPATHAPAYRPQQQPAQPAAPVAQAAQSAMYAAYEPPAAPLRRMSEAQAPLAQAPIAQSQPAQMPAAAPRGGDVSSAIQQSIARIHEACQAPPLAPPEYRMLFDVMAQEINENGLIGAQTIANIANRAQDRGVDIRRDDVRFVLEVVSEADPWFEQGASANLFAGRFRNFVVARCRSQGLNLSADELDLVEAWFAGNATPGAAQLGRAPAASQQANQAPLAQAQRAPSAPEPNTRQQQWSLEEGRQHVADQRQAMPRGPTSPDGGSEDFPRIVRTRLRG